MSTDPWTLGHETGYAEAIEVMYRAMRAVFEGTVAVFEKQQTEHDCFEGRAEAIARMREERDAHRARAEAADARVAELEAKAREAVAAWQQIEDDDEFCLSIRLNAAMRALVGDETPARSRPPADTDTGRGQ